MRKLPWILSALLLIFPASASAKADFGDAPDGAGAGYSDPAVLGAFPSLAANGGPQHRRVGALVLGGEESAESDSLQVDGDGGDDGADPQLKACSASSELRTVINAASLPRRSARRGNTFYVNAWFDWNRDGDWEDDDDRCAPEWAIENFPVDATELEDGTLPLAILFDSGSQVDELWYRVTLTLDAPVAYEDAGGPPGGYAVGETEDHFIGARGGGDGFSAACAPNPKVMLHGRVDGVRFVFPKGLSTKALSASFVGGAPKGVFRRFKKKAGAPVGIRYAEPRDGPTRVKSRIVKVKFKYSGKAQKAIKCRFVVIHTDPHKHRKRGKKKRHGGKDRWKHWRKRSWRWRHHKRPPRNPGVVLTEVPREKSESKQYAATVKVKLRRYRKYKKFKRYRKYRLRYKRMQILFTRYRKLGRRGKKLWAVPGADRKRKLYKRYLRRCKMRALATHRAHAGKSIGRGGPAVLDCPINWTAKQSTFSFDLNLNPADNAPLVVFLQDSAGNWFQPDHAPLVAPPTGAPLQPVEPLAPKQVTPNQSPLVDFTFNPLQPVAGVPVMFNAVASDPDGSIVKFEWDFDGDGTADSTQENPTHTYENPDVYEPKLTVTDSDGATAVKQIAVTVKNFLPLVELKFCGPPNIEGACTDPEPNPIIRFDLTFEVPLDGFLFDLDPVRMITGGNVQQPPAGFNCLPENGDGANDVLRCLGPVQPGEHIAGLFQTNPALEACEQVTVMAIGPPGYEGPTTVMVPVQGAVACPGP